MENERADARSGSSSQRQEYGRAGKQDILEQAAGRRGGERSRGEHERHTGGLPQPYLYQELFKKTVGPLKEAFLIYNSQGKSKGMAIVVFQRPADALVARTKYDGKIVDGSACSPFASLFGATQYRTPPVPLMLQDDH